MADGEEENTQENGKETSQEANQAATRKADEEATEEQGYQGGHTPQTGKGASAEAGVHLDRMAGRKRCLGRHPA